MRISVIIPTFNRATLLRRAIESVLRQTYSPSEIIVIDDGSTDGTAEAIAPYRDRVRYYYQENRGASAAQNRGIELARGEWISIIASDDCWLPEKLNRQVQAITSLGPDFGACFVDCAYLGDPSITNTSFERAGLKSHQEIIILSDPRTLILGRYPALYVQGLLVQRSLLEQIDGFDENLTVAEDTDLIFRLSYRTRFCAVTIPLTEIDCTPGRSDRLTNLLDKAHELALSSRENMFKGWLGSDEVSDPNLRRAITSHLIDIYYSWTVVYLRQGKWLDAWRKLLSVRASSRSFLRIFSDLVLRRRHQRMVTSA